MERDKEYDAFGPWILEIRASEDVPPLFRGWCDVSDPCLLLIKIPRKIERRNASPGMDFYDYVIGAYDTYLRILKREGKYVTEQRVDYRDIVAMKDTHALLKGELVLFTHTGRSVIAYNTVSEEIILKLIHIIEEKISDSMRVVMTSNIPVKYEPDEEGSLDMLFFNLISRMQTEKPSCRLVAYQPDMHIKRTRELVKELKTRKLCLSRTAFVVSDHELIVLERRLPRRKRTAVYDYSYLYVPLQNISEVGADSFVVNASLRSMDITLKHLKQGYVFESANTGMTKLVHALLKTDAIA